MIYLTKTTEISSTIPNLTTAKALWLDTEVADWQTNLPRLSLIQVLGDPKDLTGDRVYILDVLDKPDLVADFINQIMANPNIIKIFHNANYDLRFLGREQAKNVICTYKLAQKTSKDVLQVTDLKLKTLAAQLCNFNNVDQEEQASDWGKRSLTPKQLDYATMDVVYLAQVHRRLIEIFTSSNSTPKSNIFQTKNLSFSATKVRVGFECSRLFYLNHYFGGETLFLPNHTCNGIGNIFHKLAAQFVTLAQQEPRLLAIFKQDLAKLDVEDVASQMQQIFYELVFFPFLQTIIQKQPSKAPAMLQLWQGLKGLIQRWAELLVVNRHYCSAESVIHETFVSQECSIEHNFPLPDGSLQKVVGEFDSLIFNFELQRLCVVEFKTYQPVDLASQLAQVALYSYMLWAKHNSPVDAAVYSVLPEFKEYYFSWEQLAETVHQLIPHKLQQMRQWLKWQPPQTNPPPPTSQSHLCDICPQQTKCRSFFDAEAEPQYSRTQAQSGYENIEESETPSNKLEENTNNPTLKSDRTGKELVTTLKSFGIGVNFQGATVAPAFIRVKLKPHAGVKVNSILKLSNDLQVQLGLADPPLIAPQAGYISVDLPRQERDSAKFEQYIQPQSLPTQAAVKIAIGVNLEGNLVEADLSDPNTCHFLVGGTTGSGKSEFLRSLLLSLIVRHSPNHLKIALVDPKRVTFPEFEQMRWLYSPIVKDSDRAIELMNELVAEMERRYQMFEIAKRADLSAYNQTASQLLPRIVCIFDEYADFMAEKEIRTALEQSIKRLGAMARAAGIHLIIATQRPEAKVVTPLIRSNLPGRVALRTASEADSSIVLGGKQTAAAYLLGKGDLLYQNGAQLHRLQSLFASTIHLNYEL